MARQRTVEPPAMRTWRAVAEAVLATDDEIRVPLNGRPVQSVRSSLRYWLVPRGYTVRIRLAGDVLLVRKAKRAA